jgi:hydrogenase nickel incorporation protein HypA/HybF
MHEFSIVSSLLQLIEEYAQKYNAKKVYKVVVSIGRFSGIEPDLLKLAFDTFKEQTICEEAELIIEIQELKLKCNKCGKEAVIKEKFTRQCPFCGSFDTQFIKGEDLLLKSIEMETN